MKLKIKEIIPIINAILCVDPKNNALEIEISGCFGGDLMSDVLASIQPRALLLTGLCNPQVIRTAQMADIETIVFVRGKIPPTETIELAHQEHIILLSSPHGMFEVCGRLHQAGLESLEGKILMDGESA